MNPAQSSADGSPQNEKSSSGNIYAEYHHKDHLGNVRVAFTDRNDDHLVTLLGTANDIEITQQLDYYPFGLQQQGQGVFHTQQEPGNRYRYNGIEHEESVGLDLAFYRSYNPTLGRWMQIDPKAEWGYHLSPYNSMQNNPIGYSDPNGDWIHIAIGAGIGGAINVATHWDEVKNNPWNALSAFAIGAGAGALTAATGTGVAGAGFLKGAAIGAGSSMFGDAALQIGNGLVFGDEYNSKQTLAAGFFGALFGGAIGYMTQTPSVLPPSSTASGGGNTVNAGGKVAEDIGFNAILSEPVEVATTSGFESFRAFKRVMGPAGKGKAWHHIVEQGGDNVANFGAGRIHNTNNLISLPHGKGSIHAKISGYYSSIQPFTGGQTVRKWLAPQSFQQQYNFGIKTLTKFGWIP